MFPIPIMWGGFFVAKIILFSASLKHNFFSIRYSLSDMHHIFCVRLLFSILLMSRKLTDGLDEYQKHDQAGYFLAKGMQTINRPLVYQKGLYSYW